MLSDYSLDELEKLLSETEKKINQIRETERKIEEECANIHREIRKKVTPLNNKFVPYIGKVITDEKRKSLRAEIEEAHPGFFPAMHIKGSTLLDIFLLPKVENDESPNKDMVLAKRLKQIREEKNISQKELAEAMEINAMSVVNYESGKRTPDAKLLRKIAKYFDCSSDFLLGLSIYRNIESKQETSSPEGLFTKWINAYPVNKRNLVYSQLAILLMGLWKHNFDTFFEILKLLSSMAFLSNSRYIDTSKVEKKESSSNLKVIADYLDNFPSNAKRLNDNIAMFIDESEKALIGMYKSMTDEDYNRKDSAEELENLMSVALTNNPDGVAFVQKNTPKEGDPNALN